MQSFAIRDVGTRERERWRRVVVGPVVSKSRCKTNHTFACRVNARAFSSAYVERRGH